MELKLETAKDGTRRFYDRFNRTFMELKYFISTPLVAFFAVLIVPLWNWNQIIWAFNVCRDGFNRTFMELKFRSVGTQKEKPCFNRTFMELKYFIFTILREVTKHSFNRTFMELKWVKKTLKSIWNNCFNRTFMELKYDIADYASA